VAKVLIVDDDRTTVQLLKTLLELDGFEIDSVSAGAEVFDKAMAFQPDVFLMDYHLSDMDGVDVLRDLRAEGPFVDTPIVIASGLDVGDEVMEAGANAFLVKPFEPDELPRLFNELIGG
jgi:DNA-binding response OmpR family regulator